MDKKETATKKTEIYKGKVVELSLFDVDCPNGNKSKREIIHHNGGVCILATLNDKIVMERQYRFAYDETIYELPAGKLEKGELPYDAALRELEEETGLKAESLTEYGKMYPSPGYTDEIIYLYKANNVKKTQRHLDEDEEIDLIYLSVDEIKKMIKDNVIKDAKTVMLLLKYLANL